MTKLYATDFYTAISENKDGEIGDLFNDVASATNNMDEKKIDELKPRLDEMKSLFPGHELIKVMDEWINKTEYWIGKIKDCDNFKAAM